MPVRVIARGVAGHASVPTLGDNALLKLAPVLERLAAYTPVRRLSPELDALLDVLAPGDGSLDERIERGRAQHEELWHLLPALAGSTIVPTMARRLAQAQRHSRRGLHRVRLPRRPGHRAEELLGEFRTALDGLDVELELAEPPLGGTRSPLDTPLRDALAEWVGELEPGCAARAGDQHGLHGRALPAGGLRHDRLRFLSVALHGTRTRSTRFTRLTSASTCATSNSQCARSCTASTGSDR